MAEILVSILGSNLVLAKNRFSYESTKTCKSKDKKKKESEKEKWKKVKNEKKTK